MSCNPLFAIGNPFLACGHSGMLVQVQSPPPYGLLSHYLGLLHLPHLLHLPYAIFTL